MTQQIHETENLVKRIRSSPNPIRFYLQTVLCEKFFLKDNKSNLFIVNFYLGSAGMEVLCIVCIIYIM